jgi:hypothetical protein
MKKNAKSCGMWVPLPKSEPAGRKGESYATSR